ncbi:hypothetical protein ZWY2020_047530 [Hordeum vulgare]|nr:hypothetical protein ZWY2020_047530 [Hordeum vulgare]
MPERRRADVSAGGRRCGGRPEPEPEPAATPYLPRAGVGTPSLLDLAEYSLLQQKDSCCLRRLLSRRRMKSLEQSSLHFLLPSDIHLLYQFLVQR